MIDPNFTPFPNLATDRIRLRALNMDDTPEIYRLRSDEIVLQYLDKAKCPSVEEAQKFLKIVINETKNNQSIIWGMCLESSEKIFGTICFWRIDKFSHRAEIGYGLLPEFHRKGLTSEVLQVVIPYGFEKMDLHSIEARVNPSNLGSIKVLERTGFIKEAYFKENFFFDGKFVDTEVYSLLKSSFHSKQS